MFKKGDKVICKPGYTRKNEEYGGAGYEEGKIFITKNDAFNGNDILWPEGGGNGIYARAVGLYTESELKEQQTINNYEIF